MRFVLALALLPSIVACGGGEDSSVSGVFPSSAFLGRNVRVEISGDVTSWKDGAKVDFGPGITVNSVSVASPTALFAEITVADEAPLGLRDVTVDSGGKHVLKQAFQIESPITLKVNGSIAQGSVGTFSINQHDFETPFDDTTTGDGLFTPIEYTNIKLTSPTGTRFEIDRVTPYAITGVVFFDTNAVAGKFVVESGLESELTKSGLGEDLAVQVRAATPLTANTPAAGMVTKPYESSLYEFMPTGAGPALATLATTASSAQAEAGLLLLGPSGTFDEFFAYAADNAFVQMQTAKIFAIYWDQGGATGYNFNVKANSMALTPANEPAEPNNTTAGALTATAMPFLMNNGALVNINDVDWIKITVSAANVGKKVHMLTTGSDPQTDTVVQLFQSNGTTAVGGPSDDLGYHENHVSPAITAAGDYYVKVTASSYFSSAHNAYQAVVWIE